MPSVKDDNPIHKGKAREESRALSDASSSGNKTPGSRAGTKIVPAKKVTGKVKKNVLTS